MVGTVEQIRKDLAALETATEKLADDFKTLYDSYLKALGKAGRRQLILASYHLCTQAYPEAFLLLSLSQRQKLQEALRALGDQLQNRLVSLPESGLESFQNALMMAEAARALPPDSEDSDEVADRAEIAASLAAFRADARQQADPAELQLEGATEPSFQDLAEPVEPQEEEPDDDRDDADDEEGDEPFSDMPMVRAMLMNAVLEAIDPDLAEADEDGKPLTPARLLKRHFLMEQRIRMVLQRVSNGANRLLQKAGMLPDLPEAVLEAATDADIPLEKAASAPNLLNVLVEVARKSSEDEDEDEAQEYDSPDAEEEGEDDERDDSEDSPGMTHLVAIHLRLADIEFADPQASLWRSKLREALGKLKQMGSQYQKKQRERSIAEAELAWRSTWYDDTTQG